MQERYSRKHWEIFGWFKVGTRENIPRSITPWKLPSIKVPYYRFPRFFSFPIAFHFDELSSIIPPTIRDKRNETRVDRTSCFVVGGWVERCRPLSLVREFVREFKVERRRGGTDGSNRNRSMWRARVEWRDSIRRKDRRACRAKSGAQLRDFPYGSSRLRLKISRVSPIPDPFKNRLSILLARETLQERETFSRSYIPRESGRGRERGSGVSSVATRTIPSRFSSENMYEVTRKEAMPRFHERVARKYASTRFSFFPFFAFFRLAKKKKRKEAKFNVERRRTESERTGRKFARFPDCGCHSSRVPLDGPLDSSGNPMDEWRASVNERGPAWNGRDFFFFFFSFSSHCSPHSHIN